MQISYASGLAALSDRTRFRRYFRNTPAFDIIFPALHSTMDYFDWQRLALITQEESIFTVVRIRIQKYVYYYSSTLISMTRELEKLVICDRLVRKKPYM